MPFIRNLWYVAAWSHELDTEKPIARTIIGEALTLYRKSDGTVVCLEDRCPHRHAPLSLGRIEGDDLRCMYHGLLFSCDGHCKSIPGTESVPKNIVARAYPAHEKNSWIWVWMGNPALADLALIPDGDGDLADPRWITRSSALDYAADYQLINDNLCDLSHLDFTHETTLGWASGSKWSKDVPTITTLNNGLRLDRWFCNQWEAPNSSNFIDAWSSYRFLVPGLFLMKTQSFPVGTAAASGFSKPTAEPLYCRIDQQAVTPVAPGASLYLYATGVEAKNASQEAIEGAFAIVNAAFAEDKRMIEAQQRLWDGASSGRPKRFIPQDKAPATFRQMISRRIAEEAGVNGGAMEGRAER